MPDLSSSRPRSLFEGGFLDLVHDAQGTFRAAMDALAHPGRPFGVTASCNPPEPLGRTMAALALTLCDQDTPVWLDAALAEGGNVAAWLTFHTGASIVSAPAGARFGLVSQPKRCPRLASFDHGTPDYPDRSATLLLDVGSLSDGEPLTLTGPGIATSASIAPGRMPPDFQAQWDAVRASFPLGLDLILTCGTTVVGLPRTTRIRIGKA